MMAEEALECPVCLALPEGEGYQWQCNEGHCCCAECWNRASRSRAAAPRATATAAADRVPDTSRVPDTKVESPTRVPDYSPRQESPTAVPTRPPTAAPDPAGDRGADPAADRGADRDSRPGHFGEEDRFAYRPTTLAYT